MMLEAFITAKTVMLSYKITDKLYVPISTTNNITLK